MKKYCLVTGSSGFIGFHLCVALLKEGQLVVGIDSEAGDDPLYGVRRKILSEYGKFYFEKADIYDISQVDEVYKKYDIALVYHLAAMTGVRNSFSHPQDYIDVNIIGFTNILSCAKKYGCKKIVFASSSSVYGTNAKIPYSVDDATSSPVSVYGATKKSNEVLAYVYSLRYDMDITGLRFFTVYGEYSRSDMAMLLFANKIKNNEVIDLFHNGEHTRDFTYIGDIIRGIILAGEKLSGYHIYNLGSGNPISVNNMLEKLEKRLGKAQRNYMEWQEGDVLHTYADISKTVDELGWEPQVHFDQGVENFLDWFLSHNTYS